VHSQTVRATIKRPIEADGWSLLGSFNEEEWKRLRIACNRWSRLRVTCFERLHNANRDKASIEDRRLSVPGGSRIFFTARAYFDGLLDDVGHEGRIPHNGETVRKQRGLMLEKEPQDLREVMVFVRGTRHSIERCGECGSLAANIFAGPVFFRSGLDGRLKGVSPRRPSLCGIFQAGRDPEGRRGMQRGEG
jgi:hypothetical protein